MIRIKENDELRIKKVEMKCDSKDDISPILPHSHSCSLIIGQPGSGKTTLIVNLLTQHDMYLKKFHKVYLFSPSLDTIKKEILITNGGIFTELKSEDIESILETQKNDDHDPHLEALCIFDDFVSYLKRDKSLVLPLERLVLNRRHVFCTIIITGQKYNLIPLSIRSASSHLILFNGVNKERDEIYREWSNLDKPDFDRMCKTVFSIPKAFLYIRRDKDEYKEKYCKDFSQITIGEERKKIHRKIKKS